VCSFNLLKEEKMEKRTFKRREFLQLSAAAAAGAVASACAGPTAVVPTAETVQETVEVPVQVTVEVQAGIPEPPLLADRVASGELPPLDERLPVSPVVVGGRDAIGVYGGEVRMIHFDPVWFTSNYDWFAECWLVYSDIDLKTVVPNVFESWEVSDDGTTWTLHMREGMKWSDGQPITTEDVRFWWEDQVLNTDLAGTPDWQFRFGGANAVFEFMDDFTFKITFAGPYGNFAAQLTRWHVAWNLMVPAHYMKQFHIAYTDAAALQAMADELQVEGWPQVYWNKLGWGITAWQGPANAIEFPSMSPWVIVEMPAEGLYLWERNPYYWKVDIVGNQLPYFDTFRIDYVTNPEATNLKIMQGELDAVGQHDVTVSQYPFYKENEATSNYIVGDYVSCMGDRIVLFPQHHLAEDAVLTEIVNHPNFVRALSVAIDREEINQSLFYGLARMGAMSPMPMSKYYKAAYGVAWAQYDPDLANQLLDEMGLDQKNADGIRLRPDGQPLRYNIEHPGIRVGPACAQLTEMATTFWREIGIEATTEELQESLYNERMQNSLVHCGVWHADRCTDMLLHIEPEWYIPTRDPQQGGACAAWCACSWLRIGLQKG
jgi:peptide/nickel transport system substrate-binding protein